MHKFDSPIKSLIQRKSLLAHSFSNGAYDFWHHTFNQFRIIRVVELRAGPTLPERPAAGAIFDTDVDSIDAGLPDNF